MGTCRRSWLLEILSLSLEHYNYYRGFIEARSRKEREIALTSAETAQEVAGMYVEC